MNSELKVKLGQVLEKAYWPSQVEILRAIPRELVDSEDNSYGKPQEIEMSCYLPEELVEREREVGPQSER